MSQEEPGRAGWGRVVGRAFGPRACPEGSLSRLLIFTPRRPHICPTGNWFQMVSAQERLTRTFTRSSHTYTRTERTEISKTRGGETKREVRVEESTQVGGDPFPAVFGDFLGRERLGSFGSITRQQEGEQAWEAGPFVPWDQRGVASQPGLVCGEEGVLLRREGSPCITLTIPTLCR